MDSVEVQLKVLMLAGLAGDAKAHHRLLSAAAARLRIFFGRRLGPDAPDVEDLVQETLIAIHQRRDSFNPALPFTAWLYAIARYKLVDHYRRSGIRSHVSIDNVDEPAAADDIGPVLAASDVDRLLSELPEKHRSAIRLTRLEGYSVAEASDITGQSPSGIKIGVHRGLKKLTMRVRGEHDRD
ncbi:sigma-70 family RNA polymerase sigma factor [Sphingomonas sp.]|uniref:sigma-70 family RNA polymerase sigma factor n=1 Tax=Sphingomonas sp. TaxID=28214 RepID=UPI0017B9E22E|nr:sigma-70 family RNA polymerase sigma factor [Sphingomonas sp.]MBA3511134.1 sigma-70 family RNA polymerase sigma factor [Sphingomonas sp.]